MAAGSAQKDFTRTSPCTPKPPAMAPTQVRPAGSAIAERSLDDREVLLADRKEAAPEGHAPVVAAVAQEAERRQQRADRGAAHRLVGGAAHLRLEAAHHP